MNRAEPTLILITLLCASCSGKVMMSPLDPKLINETEITGIPVYRALPMVEVDQLTEVNVPIPGAPLSGANMMLTSDCCPAYTRQIVNVPDVNHPFALHYEHGFLESYTFSANLNPNGTLASFNSISTPDQGKTAANLASVASTFLPHIVGHLAGGTTCTPGEGTLKPTCTTTPSFWKFEPLPLPS